MSIYVDPLRDVHAITGRGLPGLWCHMLTDGELEELHQFAARIGIAPRRFQNHPRHPHYDLNPTARALAITLGAAEISTRDLFHLLRTLENHHARS
jgi:hypothetical protein